MAQGYQPANFQLSSTRFPQASTPIINKEEEEEEEEEDEEEEEEEEDFVAETQPQSIPTQQSNLTPTNQGKGKGMFPNRVPPQKWSKVEETALVSTYVIVSEDPITGNAQTNGILLLLLLLFF